MKRGKQVLFMMICLLTFFVMCMSGCERKGEEGQSGSEGQGGWKVSSKGKDLPEDAPWNHGYMAIMETENAYYSNQSCMYESGNYHPTQALRYHDKASGETILLCNKPECSHDGGDTCEATYLNILPVNCLLYEGSIYELGIETNGIRVSINLYRAALDGSAIDKVGCVISADNINDAEVYVKPATANVYNGLNQRPDYSFIIHRGVAYIPYYLQFGKGMMGLCGAGLLGMDLKTGETEQIYQVGSLTEGTPCNVMAVGDYVYFLLNNSRGNGKTRQYHLTTKEVDSILFHFADSKGNIKEMEYACALYSKDRYYTISKNINDGTVGLTAYDAETKEHVKEDGIHVKTAEGESLKTAFFYDGKLVIGDQSKAWFFDMDGNLLAQVDAPQDLIGKDLNGPTASSYFIDYKISDGKLYYLFFDSNSDVEWVWPEGTVAREDSLEGDSFKAMQVYSKHHVFSCFLEDIFQVKGTWTEAYVTQGR